ncbi:MAG: DUF4440 domain-containing protein [Acidobacteriia bacterium]|nr:DUF4440 domain-containing protein [Terriglobia bacterium]
MIDNRLVALALLSALCCSGQETPKIGSAEQEIRALETERLRSPNKADAWSGHVAKDALFHQGNGVVLNKQDFLASIHDKAFDDSLELSDTKFSQMGDVAILSYVFKRTLHVDATAILHRHLRRTVVYQRTDSGWQMITSAASVIPYADLESKPVDPKVLDTYVGVWPDTPAPATVTLTRNGGKLMAQGSNETEKTELLAISDDTFVVRGEPALIKFEKGPDGNVTRTLWCDIGGSVEVQERAVAPGKKY